MLIKKGSLINITNGSYSDYCLRGTMRALQDLDTKELVLKFAELNKDKLDPVLAYDKKSIRYYKSKTYEFSTGDEFIAWLNKEGYVEDTLEVTEWWVGEYSDIYVPE
jgi:hypothetical protein